MLSTDTRLRAVVPFSVMTAVFATNAASNWST